MEAYLYKMPERAVEILMVIVQVFRSGDLFVRRL
jgi:hypothetical protein